MNFAYTLMKPAGEAVLLCRGMPCLFVCPCTATFHLFAAEPSVCSHTESAPSSSYRLNNNGCSSALAKNPTLPYPISYSIHLHKTIILLYFLFALTAAQ
ncbi:hypothetical protein BU23DRAFT_117701 [Bimuria novae-zelandiae CBS 107.79]|uniref:Uncharacterized protein n=1 Tax=Bimuria novae-zelandiae CBS 107.79 TaxID=1447943 RepID=A0A6A5VAH0_9PLEO|nr:hypothetical protein BU23DRAFT_117701 [Bimuria novae-zelandiae CBS 107.79]